MRQNNLFAEVSAKVIAQLQAPTATPGRLWHTTSDLPRNAATQRPYRGINTLLLWIAAQTADSSSSEWATFRQWAQVGHPVRAGERGTRILFWKQLGPSHESADPTTAAPTADDNQANRRFVARAYTVFNGDQVEGYIAAPLPRLSEADRDKTADAFFNALPIHVIHAGPQAYYRPMTDTVHLPPYSQFIDANAYFAVRGHETVHATGAPHRLDRDLRGRFGDEAYAAEELVAELGAAFLCAHLGLEPEPRPDHGQYIASWLKVLQDDDRAIFTAAAKAQQAVDWLIDTASAPPAQPCEAFALAA